MLEVLLVWLLVGVCALFWGERLSFWVGSRMKTFNQFPGWINVWIGLVFISFISLVITFFTSLLPGVKLLIWLGLTAPIFYDYQWLRLLLGRLKKFAQSLNLAGLMIVGLTFFLALMKSAGLPEIFDEGAYHLPLIRMWEEQGIVIGMANLNGHYGLNSTWHVLSALANLSFVPGWQTALALNGFIVVFLGLFSASRISQITRNNLISSWIIAFLPVLIFRNLISSPATDIPAIVASWFVFTLWLECIETKNSPWSIWPVLVFIPVWIVMLKSSSAALLLIPFGMLLLSVREKPINRFWIISVAGFALLFPWILENWLLTGYGVFPIRFTALGDPDWQVPISSIDKKFYLEQFGAFAPPKSYSFSWLKFWFSAHNMDTRVLLLLALTGFVSVSIGLFRRPGNLDKMRLSLFITVLICLLVWMGTITEPRYGFGALVFAALFPIAFVARVFQAKFKFIHLAVWFLIFFQGFNLFKTWKEFNWGVTGIWQPAPRPSVAFRMLQCANFQGSTPLHYTTEVPVGKPPFCWDCPFPCIPKEGKMDSLHLHQSERFGRKMFVFSP